MIRYEGHARITRGSSFAEGSCVIEGESESDSAWFGRMSTSRSSGSVEEGPARLRLPDGREYAIQVTRSGLGTGPLEFFGAEPIELDEGQGYARESARSA